MAGLPLIVSRILVSLALATVPVDRTYNNKSFKFQSSGRQRIKYSHTWNIKGMIIETYYGGQPAREKLESIYSTKRTTGRQFQSVEDTFQSVLCNFCVLDAFSTVVFPELQRNKRTIICTDDCMLLTCDSIALLLT